MKLRMVDNILHAIYWYQRKIGQPEILFSICRRLHRYKGFLRNPRIRFLQSEVWWENVGQSHFTKYDRQVLEARNGVRFTDPHRRQPWES
jgi:hypothetical protein